MIPAWITALLQMITEGFKFGSKVTPPDEIRIDRHEEKKELREQDFSQQMINDDFRYLKRRTEINIKDYLAYVHPTLEGLEKYTEIVTARVHEFRYDRPILYRSWIKANPKK